MQKTVVAIDDDPDDLEIMGSVLNNLDPNIRYIPFNYPLEAIRWLCNEKFPVPDYVFMDINMPVMSGPECLAELRRVERFKNTPIIMCSTSMSQDVVNDLKKSGATFTFKKPNDMVGYKEILKGLAVG